MKPEEAITSKLEPAVAQNDDGSDQEQAKAQELRPTPLPLEVESKGQVEPEEPQPDQTPSSAKLVESQTAAGEATGPVLTEKEPEVDPTKVEELFTMPESPESEVLSQQEIPALSLDVSGDTEKKAAPEQKNDGLMGIFDNSGADEDSIVSGLIASIPEVNMPEILHEAGAVKELMSDLQQRSWGQEVRPDTVDSYTLRFVSKGGKDDGKRQKKPG